MYVCGGRGWITRHSTDILVLKGGDFPVRAVYTFLGSQVGSQSMMLILPVALDHNILPVQISSSTGQV